MRGNLLTPYSSSGTTFINANTRAFLSAEGNREAAALIETGAPT